jgi:transcriptional regulator with XRE-family HTH domain
MPHSPGMTKRKRKQIDPMPTLRAWREKLGLSRQQVANIMGMRWSVWEGTDQATIAKWESGETSVRVVDLKLLAEIYGTTPDGLLYDPGDHVTPEMMEKAHRILTTKQPAALSSWLASGEFLPDATAADAGDKNS